ncbi:GNAT family N-acetyltransferase, partial [Pseudomonas aeruginosa]
VGQTLTDVIAQVEQSFSPEAITTQLTKRRVFVALLGENIIGTAGLDGDVVRSVFVDPAHQKGGIGRHLMDVIHTTAASAGVGAVRVPSSITAERFYTALGYQKIRDEFHGAERTIVMEKRL